jgi:ketosteroid isomerase-like protein
VSERALALAQQGLSAWKRGDFDVLEQMLDPDVDWRWFEPGEWDCRNREDVMRTLRERHEQGFAAGALEFVDGGGDAVIVVAHPSEIGGAEWPDETATIIRFRDDRVVSMRDYRTKAQALEAVGRS